MKRPSLNKRTLGYAGIVAASLVIGIVSGWTSLATQIDDYAYDWMFRLFPPAATKPHCMILAIDDATFGAMGGVREYRTMLATGLELLAPGHPKVVGIDMVLADKAVPTKDDRLERAMQATKNLVLVAHLTDQRWENPLPRFGQWAAAVGHDTADEHSNDGVTRQIPLEQRTAGKGIGLWRWKLFGWRAENGCSNLPRTSKSETKRFPRRERTEENRPLRVLYSPDPNAIPKISIKQLMDNPDLAASFTGQTVFVGVTSDTATYDRVATPYRDGRIPGVEVHAQLFETLERGQIPDRRFGPIGARILRARRRPGRPHLCAAQRLAGLLVRRSAADGRARHTFPPFPARHRVSVLRAAGLGLADCGRRGQLSALRGAASATHVRDRDGSATSRPSISSRTRCARRSPPSRAPAS